MRKRVSCCLSQRQIILFTLIHQLTSLEQSLRRNEKFPTTALKGAQSRFAHFEKFSLNFSNSSFAIRVNLRHPWPSLFLYGLLLSLWCFSILVNYYFQGSLHLKGILYVAKKRKKKHHDWAPLNYSKLHFNAINAYNRYWECYVTPQIAEKLKKYINKKLIPWNKAKYIPWRLFTATSECEAP